MKMRGLKLGKLRRIPVLLIALLPILLAQTGQEIPRRDILHLFLINIRHFDKEAQKLQARGMLKEAKELRSYDASRAGLTTSEEALLHQEAEAMETALQEKDQQAKLTLEAAEARLKKNSKSKPGMKEEMDRLHQEREALIASHLAGFEAAMGSGAMSKLESYVRSTFSRDVKPLRMAPQELPAPMRSALKGEHQK